MLRKLAVGIVGICLVLSAPVLADPWPNYLAHTATVDYVKVYATYVSGLWYYSVSVDAGAIDPLYGSVNGVKALAVYVNGGSPEPAIPSTWTGYETQHTRTGWDYDGGWEPASGAFGYLTGSPSYYVPVGATDVLIGAAQFPVGYSPESTQAYLVHVVAADGANTYWVRPEEGGIIVPEPAGLLVVASALPAIGLLLRRRMR